MCYVNDRFQEQPEFGNDLLPLLIRMEMRQLIPPTIREIVTASNCACILEVNENFLCVFFHQLPDVLSTSDLGDR